MSPRGPFSKIFYVKENQKLCTTPLIFLGSLNLTFSNFATGFINKLLLKLHFFMNI